MGLSLPICQLSLSFQSHPESSSWLLSIFQPLDFFFFSTCQNFAVFQTSNMLLHSLGSFLSPLSPTISPIYPLGFSLNIIFLKESFLTLSNHKIGPLHYFIKLSDFSFMVLKTVSYCKNLKCAYLFKLCFYSYKVQCSSVEQTPSVLFSSVHCPSTILRC